MRQWIQKSPKKFDVYVHTLPFSLSLFQSQIEDIESKHSSEVAKLQKQIDDLDNQVLRLQMSNKR